MKPNEGDSRVMLNFETRKQEEDYKISENYKIADLLKPLYGEHLEFHGVKYGVEFALTNDVMLTVYVSVERGKPRVTCYLSPARVVKLVRGEAKPRIDWYAVRDYGQLRDRADKMKSFWFPLEDVTPQAIDKKVQAALPECQAIADIYLVLKRQEADIADATARRFNTLAAALGVPVGTFDNQITSLFGKHQGITLTADRTGTVQLTVKVTDETIELLTDFIKQYRP